MVDLVKIRKKAKEKKGKKEEPVSSPPPPVAEETTQPAPQNAAEPSVTDRLDKFLEHAGTKRQGEVARPVESTQREVLTFVIDREHYAVDIERVVSIIAPRPVTRVPNADHLVVGIISLRGTVVTLLDIRTKLGHAKGSAAPADRRVIIIEQDAEPIGFEVDRVLRVVKVDPDDIEPHPVVHASEADESIQGVFRHGDALTILLDFAKLLSSRGSGSVFRGRSEGVRAPRS